MQNNAYFQEFNFVEYLFFILYTSKESLIEFIMHESLYISLLVPFCMTATKLRLFLYIHVRCVSFESLTVTFSSYNSLRICCFSQYQRNFIITHVINFIYCPRQTCLC